MFQIAICDDDQTFLKEFRDHLALLECKHKLEIKLQCFSTGEALLNAPFNYDILFLDICLDCGLDGIEIGKELRKRGNNAIFIIISSMSTRYRDGYDATVFRYLLKPLRFEDLETAVMSAVKSLFCKPNKIAIRYKTSATVISINEILYIESYNRRRSVITEVGNIVTVESLDSLEQKLPQKQFFRPQKSFLINLNAVLAADKTVVEMKNQRIIPFVKGRHYEFNHALNKYLEDSMDANI